MTRLIVDSTCDLPEETIRRYGIAVLPLRILINGKEYRDKTEISTDEVFAAMKNGVVPKTSQANPADIEALFGKYCAVGEDFIFLSFSSAMSGTCETAKMVLSELREKYPAVKARVVDTRAGSTAVGLIVLQAARMAEKGCPFDTLTERITEMAEHAEHLFTISDIGWLVKGGRIKKLQALLGSLMNIRPILDVENGMIRLFGKARGSKNAVRAVIEAFKERVKDFPEQIVGISHSDDPEGAEALKKALEEECGIRRFIINPIGGVLGSHLGIGGLGLFFFNKKFSYYEA